jgi:hypothetical protein
VLALYFGPVHGTSHLAVECSGYDFPTRFGSFPQDVLAAIAAFFPDRIAQQRVVLVRSSDEGWSTYQMEELSQEFGLPWFDSEAAASAYLTAQTAG